MKRPATLSLVATLFFGVTTAGCYGKFALTRRIYDWNGRATNNKFANSAILWAFLIIPVYEVAGLADFFIFNTIEVFSGDNPIARQEDGAVRLRYAGRDYRLTETPSGAVEVHCDGRPAIRYRLSGDRAIVEDMAGRTLQVLDVPQALARTSGRGIY